MKHDLTKILNHARETRSRRARIDPRKVEAEEMSSSLATFRTEIAQDTVDLLERLLAVQRLARQTLADAGMPPAVDMPRLVLCSFDLAWIGKCGKPNCEKHAMLKCGSCGAPATHVCYERMGLVCGVPLCADCEHEISEDGTTGLTMHHCRKDAQKFLPWYARDSSTNVKRSDDTNG